MIRSYMLVCFATSFMVGLFWAAPAQADHGPRFYPRARGYAHQIHNSAPIAYYRFEESGAGIDHYDLNGAQEALIRSAEDGTVRISGGVSGRRRAGNGHGSHAGEGFTGLPDDNKAGSFIGNTYLELPNPDPDGAIAGTGEFSVEFLMRTLPRPNSELPPFDTVPRTIISTGNFGGNSATYMTRVDEVVEFGINSFQVTGSPVTVGEWTHIVGTIAEDPVLGDAEFNFYQNGQLIEQIFHAELQADRAGQSWFIGGYGDDFPDNYFRGALDELAFYDKALSAEDVTKHYEGLFFPEAGDPYVPHPPVPPFEPRAGDANSDMSVDTTDVVQMLSANLFETGQPATFEQGDFNGDGIFDTADIVAVLAENLFETGPYAAQSGEVLSADALTASVPEPATFGLFLFGILVFVLGRRMSHR